jgi:molybdate/tungstate transport system ATP-binding protein
MIRVSDLALRQGRFSLEGIAFEVPTGRYGVLMGKTGCGKTSVLEAVAGLRLPEKGRIELLGRDVTRLRPAERLIGYVPQDGALFRTMTVREHLAFALEIRDRSSPEIRERITPLAEWLGLSHLMDRYPEGLSGGEAQRVALGRALSFEPRVLLLDEPLSSLDEETREQMIELLLKIREERIVTVLHVTHFRSEAERMGEVRLRLVDGRILREGSDG